MPPTTLGLRKQSNHSEGPAFLYQGGGALAFFWQTRTAYPTVQYMLTKVVSMRSWTMPSLQMDFK